jgi:hypothetical protein
MWTITLLSLLAGMVLGQRFKVMILVPLSAVALLTAMAARAAAGDSLWHVVLGGAIVVTSLQIGYRSSMRSPTTVSYGAPDAPTSLSIATRLLAHSFSERLSRTTFAFVWL